MKNISSFWFNLKTWVRAVIIVILVAIVLGAFLLIMTHNKNGTVMDIAVNVPVAAGFNDDNTMNFDNESAIPTANNNRELSAPEQMSVVFNLQSGDYVPAFRADLTNAEFARGATISPNAGGTWWHDDNSATFTPASDWPADTRFKVSFDRDLFNSDVKILSREKSFRTAPLAATIENFNMYPDTPKQKSMIAVAVISFNYPIDTKTFNKNVSMTLDGDDIKFTTKFDTYNRTAFITTNSFSVLNDDQTLRVSVGDVRAMSGNAESKHTDATITIPAADNLFKISDISVAVPDNAAGEPEQLILLNMTAAAAADTKWDKYITAYLLPYNNNKTTNGHNWRADEITNKVIAASQKLKLTPKKFVNPNGFYTYAFLYDVNDKNPRQIYVDVKKGFMSDIGFALKNGTTKILQVLYPEQEIKIVSNGAILPLTGDKKLTIMARGGADTAYVKLWRVKDSEINHLVSQTYNLMSGDTINFNNYSFGADDMSVVFRKQINFVGGDTKKTNYAAVDLGAYLNKTSDNTGIFIVSLGDTDTAADYADQRLIIMTDMGMIIKENADGSSNIFVSSLSNGTAAAGVAVSVLGRNGSPIWSGTTDETGLAVAPKFYYSDYKNEREPVMFVARRAGDVSFIPYHAYERQTDFSKFDIGGTEVSADQPISAYVFSDRGIYRPGENATIGVIARDKNYVSLAGVPVRLTITDPRGKTVSEKTISLNADGMFDFKYESGGDAPVGEYNAQIYSLDDGNNTRELLGAETFRVEEFTPDTLKITTKIIGAPANDGWIKPSDMAADVTLFNLFGTPATDARLTSSATITPAQFSFDAFPNYIFASNIIAGSGMSARSAAAASRVTANMDDVRTDDKGDAKINIKFDGAINPGTYNLSFTANGFAGDSGRSVTAAAFARVSDADYLLGYRASGKLDYIAKNAARTINIIAVSPDVKRVNVDKLKLQIVKRENLVSLVRDGNDFYKYQTVVREKTIKTTDVTISDKGFDLSLDTQNGGDYYLQIVNADRRVLLHTDYFVAGEKNNAITADTAAVLRVRLDNTKYMPGSDIAVSITAPYIGNGLITIESDRVYAHKWFRANGTSSVQHITLPSDFSGSGYVNVSFVRDINSPDVFTEPYAYAAIPFAVDNSARTINIKLDTPKIIRDKKLNINYTTNKSGRVMLFAVDEGILQVAKYTTPNPISFFFSKSALQVTTYEILSLLLPEYKILLDTAKTGGGEYLMDTAMVAKMKNITNPFARTTDAPIAFYSGIKSVNAGAQNTIKFDVPDYFNGQIRVFAVAANSGAMGSNETSVQIQSPIVISATAPFAATPRDNFNVSAVVSNMTDNSGENAMVELSVATSDNLTTDAKTTKIKIPFGTEKRWNFNVSALDKLGNATITITARVLNANGDELAKNNSKSTLSVRPATTFMNKILTGYSSDKQFAVSGFKMDMYNEFATRVLYVSNGAFVLAKPLFEYLNNYEYGCSEQTVSRALPYIMFQNNKFLGTTAKSSAARFNDAINVLRGRQNDDGSFNLWDGYADGDNENVDTNTAYLTAYVLQFLLIADDNGFAVSKNMMQRATDYLRSYAGRQTTDNYDAYVKSFAIYLITRAGYVSTAAIDEWTKYADKNIKNWQQQIDGAYIAAAYKILKSDNVADDLFGDYKLSDAKDFVYRYDFGNSVTDDAAYLYLANKYFAGALGTANKQKIIDAIDSYISDGYYSSFTSAAAIMALSAGAAGNFANGITASGLTATDSGSNDIYAANIPAKTDKITIKCNGCAAGTGAFWTIMQSGFLRHATVGDNGIEITRDYLDADGNRIKSARAGDEITVRINARATGKNDNISNAVIVDLLPGGFSIVPDSISGDSDFSEVREDRAIIYGTIDKSGTTYTYRARMTAAGTYDVPQISAVSMYNPRVFGATNGDKFTIENAK